MDYKQEICKSDKMKLISILIPCYNEAGNLSLLYEHLSAFINNHSLYQWQILLIDDGSKDNSLPIIEEIRKKDQRFCYISLSRNFGKENAMLAGFDHVQGDCCVIMDADLQHPIEVIPEMLKLWEEGYDDVYAKRKCRGKESWLRKNFLSPIIIFCRNSKRRYITQCRRFPASGQKVYQCNDRTS